MTPPSQLPGALSRFQPSAQPAQVDRFTAAVTHILGRGEVWTRYGDEKNFEQFTLPLSYRHALALACEARRDAELPLASCLALMSQDGTLAKALMTAQTAEQATTIARAHFQVHVPGNDNPNTP